jgi:predicted XRE-type DNA-binding protein
MKKPAIKELSTKLKISPARANQAIIKAKIISALIHEVERQDLSHLELANRSGLSRSSVTGILSGSLQKITIDRLLKLLDAVNLQADIKLKKAA